MTEDSAHARAPGGPLDPRRVRRAVAPGAAVPARLADLGAAPGARHLEVGGVGFHAELGACFEVSGGRRVRIAARRNRGRQRSWFRPRRRQGGGGHGPAFGAVVAGVAFLAASVAFHRFLARVTLTGISD